MPPTFTYVALQARKVVLKEPFAFTTARNVWRRTSTSGGARTYEVVPPGGTEIAEVTFWSGQRKKYRVLRGNTVTIGPGDWITIQTITTSP